LGLPYAALCLVVNMAAGLEDKPISMDDIEAEWKQGGEKIRAIIEALPDHH
jgi:purine nucleoside phosphorylase